MPQPGQVGMGGELTSFCGVCLNPSFLDAELFIFKII
jgi:hypothetical protein